MYQAIWADNIDFDEVLISPTMVQDHMPDKVLEALEKVSNLEGLNDLAGQGQTEKDPTEVIVVLTDEEAEEMTEDNDPKVTDDDDPEVKVVIEVNEVTTEVINEVTPMVATDANEGYV